MTAPSSRLRRGVGVARSVYLVALVGAFAWALANHRDEIAVLTSDVVPAYLVAALVATAVQIPAAAWMWAVALRALDERAPHAWVDEAAAPALPARYVPGSVWFALGRIALLRARGVGTEPLTAVAILEAGLGFVVAAGFGIVLLFATEQLPGGSGTLVAWAAAAVSVCSPPALNGALAWFARRRGAEPQRLRWEAYVRIVGLMIGFWALSAAAFWLYLAAFPSLGDAGVLVVAGAFMVARAAGFLAVFAPQGIGVFEVAVATLVAAPERLAGAAVVVGGFRVVLLVRDAVAAVTGELAARRARIDPSDRSTLG